MSNENNEQKWDSGIDIGSLISFVKGLRNRGLRVRITSGVFKNTLVFIVISIFNVTKTLQEKALKIVSRYFFGYF